MNNLKILDRRSRQLDLRKIASTKVLSPVRKHRENSETTARSTSAKKSTANHQRNRTEINPASKVLPRVESMKLVRVTAPPRVTVNLSRRPTTPRGKNKKYKNINSAMTDCFQESILKHLQAQEQKEHTENILSRHQITPYSRAKFVDWINEALHILEYDFKTVILAVSLMDRYIEASPTKLKSDDLHLVYFVCMSLATKFYSRHDNITLEDICKKIAHDNFLKEEIANKELEVFQTLGFQIDIANPHNFLLLYVNSLVDKTIQPLIMKLSMFYIGVSNFDHEMAGLLPSLRAASCLYLALKVYNSTKNSQFINAIDDNLMEALSKASGHTSESYQSTANLIADNVKAFNYRFAGVKFFSRQWKDLFDQAKS